MRLIKRNSHLHREFVQGVYCHESFKYEKDAKLTWWSDFGFMLNNRYINVDWIHPRMGYYDLIEMESHKQVQHLYNDHESLIHEGPSTYRRVGKSRKKILLQSMNIPDSPWRNALRATKQRLNKEADFNIKPTINIEWFYNCRSLSICAPVEIRSFQDVVSLSHLIKRILKHELTLEEAFPKYEYTRSDWLRDSAIMENVEPLDIQAHSVN